MVLTFPIVLDCCEQANGKGLTRALEGIRSEWVDYWVWGTRVI